jgi:hypothetical protein
MRINRISVQAWSSVACILPVSSGEAAAERIWRAAGYCPGVASEPVAAGRRSAYAAHDPAYQPERMGYFVLTSCTLVSFIVGLVAGIHSLVGIVDMMAQIALDPIPHRNHPPSGAAVRGRIPPVA